MINSLTSDELKLICGGVVKATSNELVGYNVINFYLNLLPGVSRDHIKISYEIDEWQSQGETISKRGMVQIAEKSKMGWKALSKEEKIYALLPPGFIAFVVGTVGLISCGRFISNRINKSKS